MRASVPDRVEEGGSDALRDPLRAKGRPLVVDVDEVMVPGNSFPVEIAAELTARFRAVTATIAAALGLAARPADTSGFDPSRARFDHEAVTFLLQVLGEGRPVYLCSETCSEPFVGAVAQHLGVFTAWAAAPDARSPAQNEDLPPVLLQGFDYIGREAVTLPGFASRVARPARSAPAAPAPAGVRSWLKLLRVHQYAKNALVLVPLLTAHKFAPGSAATSLLAVVAFSLCASAAYILNDILDVEADRAHPAKRSRPIASGAIAASQAAAAMALALVTAFAIALSISVGFGGVLLGYFALTTSYSLWLKRIAIVDVVVLATLYTVRVIGGAVAISVPMSEWLLAFSLFIFMSLALVKRHIELAGQPDGAVLAARGYRIEDKSMVAILAAASGFNAVVIFTLYISSDTVRALYSHPQLLWVCCPILMYWIGRVMLFAQRGLIDDDPVMFALRDRASWAALGAIGVIMLAAI
ncbi:UbiA family prenyltransferase [Bradyrhizobium sp. CCBAU 53421]|uniref:UbiA family prenyltransferase n=1 Tax=Bradyrhizobium sp. CCBAU 53421 TaxID=1325120 RepID=UPI00188BE077|nr:UbiA family prenyltransferase [Bradyrhizobium sp. CCBAU 53421]QOZ37268.1 UbiA family prenyltransferase [Bradyrhizobium sp. CCBAU 53421]